MTISIFSMRGIPELVNKILFLLKKNALERNYLKILQKFNQSISKNPTFGSIQNMFYECKHYLKTTFQQLYLCNHMYTDICNSYKHLPLRGQFQILRLRQVFQFYGHKSFRIQLDRLFLNVLWSHQTERNEKTNELGGHNIG